jgi:pimeloyl-ACP methyl ester carboxylesterase
MVGSVASARTSSDDSAPAGDAQAPHVPRPCEDFERTMADRPEHPRARHGRARRPIAASVLLVAGVAAIAAAGATFATFRRDLGIARERVAAGSAVVATRCGPIEFAETGSGPAVLVVHGAGGGFDQGLDFAAPLAQQGLRVIAMSRFGYLRTPLPADASAAAQADAHACLLDALGIARAAIVGASAGAPSAMQFALRHAERCSALVLLVPAAYVPRPGGAPSLKTPAWTQFLFDTALRSDFLFWAAPRLSRSTVLRAILATPPEVVARAPASEQARVQTMVEHLLPVAPRRLGLLNDAHVTSTLPRYELERIAVPTLAISAADDLFGTFDAARYTAEHVRGARFVGFADGGHVWVGHHDAVIGELAAFLR